MTDYQLTLVKIPVSQVRRSADFYRDALGFHEEFVVEEYGWAQLKAGDVAVALYEPGKGSGDGHIGGSTGFHLSLPPQRFDPLGAELLKRGVLTENMIHRSDDGSTFVEVRDPDNNTLKIVRDGGK